VVSGSHDFPFELVHRARTEACKPRRLTDLGSFISFSRARSSLWARHQTCQAACAPCQPWRRTSHRVPGGAFLAAATIISLGLKPTDAQRAQSGSPSVAQEEPIKRTVLFRGNLKGMDGKEIVIFIADLAPGAVGSKHCHPGPEYFYVREGALAHAPEGSPELMKVGDFGSNPNKSVHTIRNPDTTARARAIDFLISETGQPLVVPVNYYRRTNVGSWQRFLSIYLIPKPDVEGHETIAMKETQCTFVERPGVQGNHRYPLRSTVCLGCVQKGSADPLSACARADANLVDIDQFVRELPRCLGAADNFSD
jgi:quercetin dioxygenase-like cupin family protein